LQFQKNISILAPIIFKRTLWSESANKPKKDKEARTDAGLHPLKQDLRRTTFLKVIKFTPTQSKVMRQKTALSQKLVKLCQDILATENQIRAGKRETFLNVLNELTRFALSAAGKTAKISG
jgi:hypothetical protein